MITFVNMSKLHGAENVFRMFLSRQGFDGQDSSEWFKKQRLCIAVHNPSKEAKVFQALAISLAQHLTSMCFLISAVAENHEKTPHTFH